MKFKGLYTAMTALSLVAAPTLAAAAPIATPLTQTSDTTAQTSDTTTETAAETGSTGVSGSTIVIALAAVAAIGLGVYVAVDKDDARPNSP